ncbi:hypothetical protein Ancab_018002 [Ancistrocladus abbreviatus]
MWSEDFFNRLASLWGTLVDIDKITSDRVRFDEARFSVQTTSANPIRGLIHLQVEEDGYLLQVAKETPCLNNLILVGKDHTPDKEVAISPKHIWDFISRVGVEPAGDEEAAIQ